MKILNLVIITIFATSFIMNSGIALAQYGPGFSAVDHYPSINDTKLELLVMNSTEFEQRTTGYNYTFAGVDYDWISKGNNNYDFGGARVTFFVWGFDNETTKGETFNLDSQMNVKNVFEYNADKPPAGYRTGVCMGCPLITGTKPECCGPAYTSPILDTPLKQFRSGIAAKDVKCNQGLELLMKSHDNMPACVKSTSIQRLLGQGWINPYNFNGENIDKESISLSAYQGVSNEAFYNNGTVASDFTINVNINNFKPSNASLVLQVYYSDGMPYKTVTVSSDMIQPDGFYKYHLIAVSDKNHPPPFKVVATYNDETAIAYAPVFAHP